MKVSIKITLGKQKYLKESKKIERKQNFLKKTKEEKILENKQKVLKETWHFIAIVMCQYFYV